MQLEGAVQVVAVVHVDGAVQSEGGVKAAA